MGRGKAVSLLTLYHGSEKIISMPEPLGGSPFRDFGAGFYVTESREAAGQWACSIGSGGFINSYKLETDGLKILDLSGPDQSILNWLALVMSSRKYRVSDPLFARALDYLISNFLPDTQGYDMIRGNRADEIYFFFAKAFMKNQISLRQFRLLMNLGPLGEQLVIRSDKAFERLSFDSLKGADSVYSYPKKKIRNSGAMANFIAEIDIGDEGGLFMEDIFREEIKPDDGRLR